MVCSERKPRALPTHPILYLVTPTSPGPATHTALPRPGRPWPWLCYSTSCDLPCSPPRPTSTIATTPRPALPQRAMSPVWPCHPIAMDHRVLLWLYCPRLAKSHSASASALTIPGRRQPDGLDCKSNNNKI